MNDSETAIMASKEKDSDLNDYCRLCAVKVKNEIVIYSSEGKHLCLEEKITRCFQVKINKDDMLPKKICYSCISRLEEYYNFVQQVSKAQNTFEVWIEKKEYSRMSERQKSDVSDEKEDVKADYTELPLDVTIEEDVKEDTEIYTNDSDAAEVEEEECLDSSASVLKKHSDRKDTVLNQKGVGLNLQTKRIKCQKVLRTSRTLYLPVSCTVDQELVNEKQKDQILEDSYGGDEYLFKDTDISEVVCEGEHVQLDKEEIFQGPENGPVITKISYDVEEKTYGLPKGLPPLVDADEEIDKDESICDLNERNEWKTVWGIKCDQCEQLFPYKMLFDEHYKTYNKKPVYTCSCCNKTMEKYSTFRSHCYRHVTEGRYRCQYCKKGFGLRSSLDVHILAKHTSEKPFMCQECGKGFVTRPGLNIHLKKHQEDEKTEHPCPDCGKILQTSNGLKAHQNVHKLGRRFMCDICGKTFTQKVNMLQHVKHHTGERPFTCEKCGKCFAEKSHLNRHYSYHSEKRPFQCPVCLKMYKTERCLKVHSMVHAESRPYVCKYCNKGFLSTTKLKQHCNIHTGERPYACKFCERTFTNYPNWLKHTRRRHKVDARKPNTCSLEWLKLTDKEDQQLHQHLETQIVQTNSLNSLLDGNAVQSQLKTFPQVDERFNGANQGSSPSSSTNFLHQYPSHSHTEEIKHISSQRIGDSLPVQRTDQMLQQQFSLAQVYSGHIIGSSEPESESESILPL